MPKTPGAPLGLAIAGLGMAGAVMVRAAAVHPGVKLVAAADPHDAPRDAFARDFNARAYADIAELCADPAADVVYIATPHQFHAAIMPSRPSAPLATLRRISRTDGSKAWVWPTMR